MSKEAEAVFALLRYVQWELGHEKADATGFSRMHMRMREICPGITDIVFTRTGDLNWTARIFYHGIDTIQVEGVLSV